MVRACERTIPRELCTHERRCLVQLRGGAASLDALTDALADGDPDDDGWPILYWPLMRLHARGLVRWATGGDALHVLTRHGRVMATTLAVTQTQEGGVARGQA
jgi:hypothetical protein